MPHVLLVEDEDGEDGFGSSLVTELHEMGLKSEWAKEGAEALRFLETQRYDGVILDLRLSKPPTPQGIQILEWLNAKRPDTAVVVVTAFSHLAFRALDLGVDALIQKPVEPQHVVQYLQRAIQLRSLKKENERLSELLSRDGKDRGLEALRQVERICERFHLVVRQLHSRRGEREPFLVKDEFDVQDLLHALLMIYFDDVRPEEFSPSFAGSGSRLDFLLKAEGLVVEIKRARKTLSTKELGDELLVDIQRYRGHPDCRRLVCFVYDPDGHISNPHGIEADLTRSVDGFEVRALIAPKSF